MGGTYRSSTLYLEVAWALSRLVGSGVWDLGEILVGEALLGASSRGWGNSNSARWLGVYRPFLERGEGWGGDEVLETRLLMWWAASGP